jgi:hypothetical protein
MNNSLQVALEFAERFKGCKSITYKGNSFPCTLGDETAIATLEWGAFSQRIDKLINVRKSVFSDGIYPQNQDPITLDGTIYLVEKVAVDSTDTFLQIALRKK